MSRRHKARRQPPRRHHTFQQPSAQPPPWAQLLQPLVLTTLLHFAALLPLAGARTSRRAGGGYAWQEVALAAYAGLITACSLASAAWHAAGEPGRAPHKAVSQLDDEEGDKSGGATRPRHLLAWLDHGLAALWAAADVVLALTVPGGFAGRALLTTSLVLALNAGTAAAHSAVERAVHRGDARYASAHSAWHVLSAGKGWLVARLLVGALARA